MVSRRGLAALVAIALAGCQTVTPEAEHPARMIDADDDSRAALGRGVDTLMGTHVTLAPDAPFQNKIFLVKNNCLATSNVHQAFHKFLFTFIKSP